MEVQSLTRYARMSPKKVREVARTIQGRKAADAVEYLTLVPRKSARLIAKTLKSAIANAENNNNLSTDSLVVKSAIIENGPVLKRFKAGARGTAMPRQENVPYPDRSDRRIEQLLIILTWAKRLTPLVFVSLSVATGSLAGSRARRISANSSPRIS